MNYLSRFSPEETSIGIINPANNEIELHEGILGEADGRGFTCHRIEVVYNPGFFEKNILDIAALLIKHEVCLVIGPGFLIRDTEYRMAGNIAVRASYRAARIMGLGLDLLAYNPGRVIDASHIAEMGTPAQYSRLTIGEDILTANHTIRAESLVSDLSKSTV